MTVRLMPSSRQCLPWNSRRSRTSTRTNLDSTKRGAHADIEAVSPNKASDRTCDWLLMAPTAEIVPPSAAFRLRKSRRTLLFCSSVMP
uniref:Uncharacterized protein n=1 Tax=Arundo donax TaxID=35708 RepID=A0A0A8XXV3_ARUDO